MEAVRSGSRGGCSLEAGGDRPAEASPLVLVRSAGTAGGSPATSFPACGAGVASAVVQIFPVGPASVPPGSARALCRIPRGPSLGLAPGSREGRPRYVRVVQALGLTLP